MAYTNANRDFYLLRFSEIAVTKGIDQVLSEWAMLLLESGREFSSSVWIYFVVELIEEIRCPNDQGNGC